MSIPQERTKIQVWGLTDLRPFCRDSDTCFTQIDLFMWLDSSDDSRHPWLRLGRVELHPPSNRGSYGPQNPWTLKAYLDRGATDASHDSAQILRMPLIGVELQSIWHNRTRISAYIDPTIDSEDRFGEFRVPLPGYNPFPDGHKICAECEGADKGHPIVDYLPPFDAKLYRNVRGKQIEITLGVPHKGE